MSDGMKYGDVALGVESALPVFVWPDRSLRCRPGFIIWLIAALRRWA